MEARVVLVIVINLCFTYFNDASRPRPQICGVDNAQTDIVKEGVADIDTYPWLGLLFYPVGLNDDVITTTIVLITRQMALASALDIDKYPKSDFREMARVVLGHNCSGPHINVIDYTYHPDFSKNTFSTLAIVQLDTKPYLDEVLPICAPPKSIGAQQVYAMSLTQDCTSSSVRIYKMEYVDDAECKDFYRRSNLDILSMWPTHYACARATQGGNCIWRSGTVLVVRDNDRWKLIGFGIHGPGCESPARFLDFGIYAGWVRRSLAKIGRPAITRISPDHIILRRTTENVQRFGTCDPEETKAEIYTDHSAVSPKPFNFETFGKVSYNLTLFSNMDYSCISLRVYSISSNTTNPTISLRRWCTNPLPVCFDFNILQVEFSVDIEFQTDIVYILRAYGREVKLMDLKALRLYTNKLYYGMKGRYIPPVNYSYPYQVLEFTTSAPLPDHEVVQDPQLFGVHNIRTTTMKPTYLRDHIATGNFTADYMIA